MGITRPNPPAPVVHAFLVCREIFRDEQSQEVILVGPRNFIPVMGFPATVRFSLFVQITGAHGNYELAVTLRSPDEEEVWTWYPPGTDDETEPLLPRQVVLQNFALTITQPARYRMILIAHGEEVAFQPLFIQPPRWQSTQQFGVDGLS